MQTTFHFDWMQLDDKKKKWPMCINVTVATKIQLDENEAKVDAKTNLHVHHKHIRTSEKTVIFTLSGQRQKAKKEAKHLEPCTQH